VTNSGGGMSAQSHFFPGQHIPRVN